MPLQPRSLIQNLVPRPTQPAKVGRQRNPGQSHRSRRPATHPQRNPIPNFKRQGNHCTPMRRQRLPVNIEQQVPLQSTANLRTTPRSQN